MSSPISLQWQRIVMTFICLTVVVTSAVSSIYAQTPAVGVDLEILVRRPDQVELRITVAVSPDLSDRIVRSLERADVRPQKTSHRRGIRTSQLTVHVNLGGMFAHGQWFLHFGKSTATENGPFLLVRRTVSWPQQSQILLAGVTSGKICFGA